MPGGTGYSSPCDRSTARLRGKSHRCAWWSALSTSCPPAWPVGPSQRDRTCQSRSSVRSRSYASAWIRSRFTSHSWRTPRAYRPEWDEQTETIMGEPIELRHGMYRSASVSLLPTYSVTPGSLTLCSVHLLLIKRNTAPLTASNAAIKPNALAPDRRFPMHPTLGRRIHFRLLNSQFVVVHAADSAPCRAAAIRQHLRISAGPRIRICPARCRSVVGASRTGPNTGTNSGPAAEARRESQP
jgi:hypothetical protein